MRILVTTISLLFGFGFLVLANQNGMPKIKGGHDTNITEVPWQLLHMVNGTPFAGGIIIGPREVLTAAHCFTLVNVSNTLHQYRSGYNQRYGSGGTNHTVEYYVVHPEFSINIDENHIIHDIAFARVKEPFEFSESVQPIKLARKEPTGGETALISGFGLIDIDISDPDNITYEFPNILQSVTLPIVNRTTCKEWYADFVYHVQDDQICAARPEGGLGGCNGDSGGPLVIDKEVAGITSWGYPCAVPHRPTVYTSVAQYIDWIEEQMNSSN